MLTPSERVKAFFEKYPTSDASECAMELIDEDVSNGDYEGCSSELDLAASEYMAIAHRMMEEGVIV